MKNKIIQNLPESYSKFVVKFKANIDRLNKTKETIFESTIDSSQITDAVLLEHYNYFVKNYLDEYNSNGRDQAIILKSIYESYNQSIFNSAIDAVIINGAISYSNQILLENTEAKCNVQLDKVGKEILLESNLPLTKNVNNEEKELGIIQENLYGFAAGGGAMALGAGALPALGIGAIVSIAASLLVSSKHMNDLTQIVGNLGSIVFRAFTSQLNYLNNSFFANAEVSRKMLINFDNIDADKTVIDLFKKMQKTTASNPRAAEQDAKNGLATIVAQCVEQNRNIFDIADKDVTTSLFNNPKNYNLFKMFWKSTLGNANSDKNDHDTLLRFRKCLSNKLVDVYKLLLISNLQNRGDHKRITEAVSKINSGRPELILQFIPKETPEDEKLQEAILALVQFRIHLWNLSKDLQSGMFDLDREAGKFLQQKLTTVDAEVESFLRLNQHKWAPREENPNRQKVEFKKRTFLSNHSSL
mgnify:FL=1